MTTISDSPVIYTSFLSVKLKVEPSEPSALPSIRTVGNPPPEQHAFLQKRTMAGPVVSGSPSASAESSANAAADTGDWECFVDHLQRQGKVPGAAADDPERGVVTPANISVKQMLAFLRNQPPSTPAGGDAPLRQHRASTPSRVTSVPIPPVPGAATAKPEAASAGTLPQHDDPMVVVVDPWGTAALMDEMEHLHEPAGPRGEPAQPQVLDDDQALDEALRMREQNYRPHSGELHTVYEEHDEDPFHPSELFGTMPRTELARARREAMLRGNAVLEEHDAGQVMRPQGRLRNVRFDQIETSRVLEVDAESGASLSVTDAFFLTKEHDGKWERNQARQSISPDRISDSTGNAPRLAAFATPRTLRAADDSGCVVHSVFHENRYDQPTHAEIRETFWADLGRDDEPATPPASGSFWGDLVRYSEQAHPLAAQALFQMERLDPMQRKLSATLRHNQQLDRDIGVYF